MYTGSIVKTAGHTKARESTPSGFILYLATFSIQRTDMQYANNNIPMPPFGLAAAHYNPHETAKPTLNTDQSSHTCGEHLLVTSVMLVRRGESPAGLDRGCAFCLVATARASPSPR